MSEPIVIIENCMFPDTDLDEAKKVKNFHIDQKTRDLIAMGFIWDGENFSASSNAQRNYIAIDEMRDDLGYPFSVTTLDDGEYNFANSTDLHNFALYALGAIAYHYNTGRAIKLTVDAATTIAEVDAIEDNR